MAAVVVTYDRADLLRTMLAALAVMDPAPDAVIVVDNASTDHTPDVLADAAGPVRGLRVERLAVNVGGAGGFAHGVALAHAAGHDRIWLMDDDVVPAPDCLGALLAVDPAGDLSAREGLGCLAAVREGPDGALCEKAALRFDLTHPWVVRPKTAMVETTYRTRAAMPPTVPIENAAFEGLLVHRRVVDAIGLPDASFFIFYDDCDYVIRAREAGFPVLAVRDAVLRRQLDFDQQHDLAGWKGYFMYRNLFVVHRRHGTNALVRLKPAAIALAVVLVALLPGRGGAGEARNVWRALRDARRMDRPGGPVTRDGRPVEIATGVSVDVAVAEGEGVEPDSGRAVDGWGAGPGLS